ncbi:hypothetical protein Pelo_5192 [Pelomyxa schiedti]|nr:hypothetical protein Pelo_5192 [Pelomyxa schiedti]
MIARSPCHLVGIGHSVRDLILSGSIELTFHCSCLQVFSKGFACDDDVVDVHQPLEGIGLLCIQTLFCEYLLVQVCLQYFENIRQWIVILLWRKFLWRSASWPTYLGCEYVGMLLLQGCELLSLLGVEIFPLDAGCSPVFTLFWLNLGLRFLFCDTACSCLCIVFCHCIVFAVPEFPLELIRVSAATACPFRS